MEELKIHTINNQKYIATKLVRHNGNVYQEYKSTNLMHPKTVYTDSAGREVTDKKTYYELLQKFAVGNGEPVRGGIITYD